MIFLKGRTQLTGEQALHLQEIIKKSRRRKLATSEKALSIDAKPSQSPYMDDDIATRFEEYEEALRAYEKQLATLKEDLKMVLRFSHPNIVRQARQEATRAGGQSPWANPPPDESELRERVKRFVERYGNLEGSTL